MFGYRNKRSNRKRELPAQRNLIGQTVVASLVALTILMFSTVSYADKERRWEHKSPQEKRALEQRRREFKSLSRDEREKIKDRYQWYKDLPPEKQKELRERWKKSDR